MAPSSRGRSKRTVPIELRDSKAKLRVMSPPAVSPAVRTAWRTGYAYTATGLRVLAFTPWTYVALAVGFALPPAGAILIALSDVPHGPGRTAAITALNFLGGTVPPVMFMMAVSAGYHGQRLSIFRHLWNGTIWLPRYLWTNAHTSVIFWGPVLAMLFLYRWYKANVVLGGFAGEAVPVAFMVTIAALGLYLHTRTLLAPFLAVHGNLPGTLAALESWRLSGRHFPQVFGTMAVSGGPIAIPLSVIFFAVLFAVRDSEVHYANFISTLLSQVAIAIKLVRPVVVTATYGLFQEYWPAEVERRRVAGAPPTPWLARALLAISWWPSKLLSFTLRRPIPGPL